MAKTRVLILAHAIGPKESRLLLRNEAEHPAPSPAEIGGDIAPRYFAGDVVEMEEMAAAEMIGLERAIRGTDDVVRSHQRALEVAERALDRKTAVKGE